MTAEPNAGRESWRPHRPNQAVDDFTRECLGLVAGTSLSGLRAGREPDRIATLRGRPALIVSGNGTALTSHAMPRWQQDRGVAWHSIAPDHRSAEDRLRHDPPAYEPERAHPSSLLQTALRRGKWRTGSAHE